MDPQSTAMSLCHKYNTRDPFLIADHKNIIVLFEPLGGIKGYYNHFYRQKIIHINDGMSRQDQLFTCAHELGHSVLHPNSNTPFLRANTLFQIGKYENEADYFAVNLIYSDDYLKQFLSFTVKEIAMCMNVSERLAEYRLSCMGCEK